MPPDSASRLTTEAREQRRSREAARRERAEARATGRSAQPIQYKLPSHLSGETPVIPENTAALDIGDEVDYAPLIRGSLRVAVLMFLTQFLAAVIIANFLGGVIRFAFWFGFIPYLEIWTDRESYASIVTWSTAAAVASTCMGVVLALIRRRDEPLLLDGWGTGLPMLALLLLLQLVRERTYPVEVVDDWVIAQAAAVTIATTMIFVGFRPGRGNPAKAGRSHATGQLRSGGTVTPTNQEMKEASA